MENIEALMDKINEKIEKLKENNILVNIKMPIDEKDKFSTYSTHELNSISYEVIYTPKNIVLYEDEYYINFFVNYLINLNTKSDKINYFLENVDENAHVSLGLVKYNSYFHFTKDEVIINIDTFSEEVDRFKNLINVYNRDPRIFIRNIVENKLSDEFNDLMRKGKMRFFNSTIFNVKVKGKKYVVFTTSNASEKIMYILDEDNNYLDILDERYSKILKKLSLINGL